MLIGADIRPHKEAFNWLFFAPEKKSRWYNFQTNGKHISVRFVSMPDGEVRAQMAVGGISSEEKLRKAISNLPHSFLWRAFKRFVNAAKLLHNDYKKLEWALLPVKAPKIGCPIGIALSEYPMKFYGIDRVPVKIEELFNLK
jgi:hypothetical protein